MSSETEPRPSDVVICYSSKDEQLVNRIARALGGRGVSVWWGPQRIPGNALWIDIAGRAIRDCTAVLVVCTDAALSSQDVRGEANLAWNCKKPLIPLWVEGITPVPDLPSGWVLWIGQRQGVNATGRRLPQWLPDLLASLQEEGVKIGRRQYPLPPEPELREITAWLRKLDMAAPGLRARSTEIPEQDEAELAFKRRLSAVLNVLTIIDDDLPNLYGTFVALARDEDVPDEEAAALRQTQEALVDMAKALMRLRRESPGEFDHLPLPPYDLWLPFKVGRGKLSVASAGD